MGAQPVRFVFEDFNAPASRAPEPAHAGDDAIAAAHEEGFAAGKAAAASAAEGASDAALDSIATALAQESAGRQAAIAADRADMLAAARSFLETFCGRIAAAREVDAASELLGRIAGFPPKGARLKLYVARSFDEEKRAAIAAHAARITDAPPVAVIVDEALSPGEARLEWSDGAVRRTRAEIDAAVTRLIEGLDHHLKEAQS
jgi:hypothetical protein